jgi:hypothetical protein
MNMQHIYPGSLAIRLIGYFAALVIGTYVLITAVPSSMNVLPIGGLDLDLPGSATELLDSLQGNATTESNAQEIRLQPALALLTSLTGTILLMLPITWVYMATKQVEGYRKSFIGALIVLPICATSIVMLIQNSLPLAFGLTALVAAVRFRVRLNDALDGIYVFAAICVGLASGIGYLGVGAVMTAVFCFASLVMWSTNYGANPIDDAEQARKLARLKTESREQHDAD